MNKPGSLFTALLALALLCPALRTEAAGYKALLPLLVDFPGWEAEPAEGAEASAEGMRAVTVYRTYESGERKFEANLLVGLEAEVSWLPEYKDGYRVETSEGLLEVKEIAGFLVSYMFVRQNKSGGILVLLQAGAYKPGTGAVLAISFEGLPLEEALQMAQHFDWAKMKDQVGKLN
jgi:hypothetical protein